MKRNALFPTALWPVLVLAYLLSLLVASPVAAASPASPASGASRVAAAATAAAPGRSTYVPVDPVRVLDTRSGLGAPTGPVEAGGVRDLRVVDGVRVPVGATAVVLNVTVTEASSATDVRVYPTPAGAGEPPTVSNLNTVRGSTVANLVTVALGAGGQVRLRNAAGQAHLIADLAGFFTASGDGASLVAGAPRRLLDTRDSGVPLGAGGVRRLQVVGPDGVPAGTAAVVLNLTAVGATAQTDVRVYPTRPGPPPVVSTSNPSPGRTTAAAVVVPVGADGTVSLRNSAGSVHLVADLLARYAPGQAGSLFAPVAPVRLLDTRTTRAPLGPGGTRDLVVAGRGVVPAPGTVVVLNVTATGPTAASDVRVHAAGTASPGTSTSTSCGGRQSPTPSSPRSDATALCGCATRRARCTSSSTSPAGTARAATAGTSAGRSARRQGPRRVASRRATPSPSSGSRGDGPFTTTSASPGSGRGPARCRASPPST